MRTAIQKLYCKVKCIILKTKIRCSRFNIEHFMMCSRREQYYWVRYWYWVILVCFRTIGIVKGFTSIKDNLFEYKSRLKRV